MMSLFSKVNEIIDSLNFGGLLDLKNDDEIPGAFIANSGTITLSNNNVITIPMTVTNNSGYTYENGVVTIMNKGSYFIQAKFNFEPGERGTRVYWLIKNGSETLVTESIGSAVALINKEYNKPHILLEGDTIEIKLGQANTPMVDINASGELIIHRIR